jgi:hypothetical protein
MKSAENFLKIQIKKPPSRSRGCGLNWMLGFPLTTGEIKKVCTFTSMSPLAFSLYARVSGNLSVETQHPFVSSFYEGTIIVLLDGYLYNIIYKILVNTF